MKRERGRGREERGVEVKREEWRKSREERCAEGEREERGVEEERGRDDDSIDQEVLNCIRRVYSTTLSWLVPNCC